MNYGRIGEICWEYVGKPILFGLEKVKDFRQLIKDIVEYWDHQT